MNIIKYKKMSNNKYKVFLDNNDVVVLHEDIILKYNLLINKSVDNLNEIIKDNNNYMIYDMIVKYISIKMRCESQIIDYLNKKEVDKNLQEKIIDKLKQNNLIDDRLYARCYISDKIRLNKIGLNKIKCELKNLKIDENIINEEIEKVDINELNSTLENLIDKKIKVNKTYASDILKQKLLNEFILKGYDREDILKILDKKDLSNDELYEKEYKKLYNKYSKKYSSDKLEYIIKQKLFQKGIKKE